MPFFVAVSPPAIPPPGLKTQFWTHGEAYPTREAAEEEMRTTFPRMWILDGVVKVVEATDADTAVQLAEQVA